MLAGWLIEFLKGFGYFFVNPLLYIFLLFSWIIGFRRVKRERKDFNIRIYSSFIEWTEFASPGILIGLLLSGIMIGLGMVVPVGFLLLIFILSMVAVITFQPRWLSSAFVVGFALILSLIVPKLTFANEWLANVINELANAPLIGMAALLSLLLLTEGILVLKKGAKNTAPLLLKSKRGKPIGKHEAKKLWMVPIALLIPGEGITSLVEWWPVITTPYETFSILVIPFGIGFQQQVQSGLPKELIENTGRKISLLAIIVLGLTVGSYWVPALAIVAAIVAIIGREIIAIVQKIFDDQHTSYFASRDVGMVILGVIPDSPASKMALLVGEIVTKVNGQQVRSEKEFYEALQINAAYCKLEVLDYRGEVRFAQRALYDGEHHELGLLFIPQLTGCKTPTSGI